MLVFKGIIGFLLVIQLVGALKLKLSRDEPKSLKLLREGRFSEYHLLRNQQRQNLEQRYGHFDAGKSKIGNVFENYYIVNVSLGNPPQTFSFLVDFSHAFSYVFDKTALNENNETMCGDRACFDSEKSSSYIKNGTAFGSSDWISGFFGIDSFQLGDSQSVTIKNATFGQLTWVDDIEKFPSTFEGFLGLGFEKVPEAVDMEPIIQQAISQNLLNKPVYTIWVNQSGEIDRATIEGQLTIGDLDTDHCSDVVYFDALDSDWFSFQIDATQMTGERAEHGNWTVMLQPTLEVSLVTSSAFYDIVDASKAKYNFATGLYEVDCNKKFQFTLFAGQKQLVIDEKVGIIKIHGSSKCYLAFEERNSKPDFMLSDAYIKEYCLTRTANHVGFARRISNDN